MNTHLNQLPTGELRSLVGSLPADGAAHVWAVLNRREDAHNQGMAAGRLLLDTLGGTHVAELHNSLLGAAKRQAAAGEYLASERSLGFAGALYDWIRERSDT